MVHGKFKRNPSVQDISWFIDLHQSEKLDLQPPYQRRSVWSRQDRIFFINTIFKGYPCPAIYINKTMDDAGTSTYHIIDGKQRLETIFLFINNKIKLPLDFDIQDLADKRWRDIETKYKRLFWSYVLPVDQVDVNIEEDPKLIDEIFDRLNRNMKKLEPQELRHAKYQGWFIEFAEKITEKPKIDSQKKLTKKQEDALQHPELKKYNRLKELNLITVGKARRMKDVQFISELLMVQIEKSLNGFSQDGIDAFYAKYDDIIDLDTIEEQEIDIDDDREQLSVSDIHFDFYKTMNYIYDMNLENECITKYAKGVGAFYTLFAFITLTKEIGSSDELAKKYSNFMSEVEKHRDNTNSKNTNTHIIEYANNSVGASTDINRRTKRLEALKNYILEN